MQSIQVGQLKNEFSSILKKVENQGETFVIEYGKKHKKVAMLIPYTEKKEGKREFSPYKNKGSFTLSNSFEMTEEELLEA